ncbi:MAG: sulfite exporter TauE/SafE family protein [Alphaproteobacteria bacterium]|nr:sulfite exporter TauE/SafE family protein [Alphaproteobacteria bacterium]
MPVLFFIFLLTALIYASVGFGGGSTYNAVLVLYGVDYQLIPVISLACNALVVSGSLWRFYRTRHLNLKAMLPLSISSVPAAFIGGVLMISEPVFTLLLGLVLFASGLRLVWPEKLDLHSSQVYRPRVPAAFYSALGAFLGFLAGLTGIGGGIFLAPILYFLNWGTPRQISAASSVFILVNSLAGLCGQLVKLGSLNFVTLVSPYFSLLIAVLIGGQIGSLLCTKTLHPSVLKKATGLLILYVSSKLLLKI